MLLVLTARTRILQEIVAVLVMVLEKYCKTGKRRIQWILNGQQS
jgi:hypothetical protein